MVVVLNEHCGTVEVRFLLYIISEIRYCYSSRVHRAFKSPWLTLASLHLAFELVHLAG
jgi:hypothetical protein